MLAWTSHDRQRLLSAESRQRFEKARQKSALLDDAEQLRGALLDFIADFANWDNSTVKEYVGTSRALTHAAHQALGGAPGSKPVVVDPFAGGGAIPLEALRVGCEAFASDLNQVSIAICRVVLEHVPNYGERLLREVLRGVEWMQREAGKELGPYFQADEDGSKPIAYLWARTILSEAPEAGGNHPVEVPLLRTLWLATKAGTRRAMRWVRDKKGVVQTELAEVTYADGSVHTVRRPLLEVFEPKTDSDVEGRVPVVVEK
jgi:putative DNA methylase